VPYPKPPAQQCGVIAQNPQKGFVQTGDFGPFTCAKRSLMSQLTFFD
jgi:hypothetical protein